MQSSSNSFCFFFLLVLCFGVLCPLIQASECPKSNCNCNGIRNSIFCGDGQGDCLHGHAYICNAAGEACDSGVNTSCRQCNKTSC
ncbi:hypothetical protein BCR42DRAFT_416850 [Absidia repens]|uniref:Uncharacterized protein n=1 Tax=Absidia repens TaxID=90262 RepID=A0A1X2IF45_9FUNG|nr:hypothetical protein BCR42DRAFT_416850 [Absidia repens]